MTALHGEWFSRGIVQRCTGMSRTLRTVVRASARYGWRNLAARAVGVLRRGGPALLLQKFREQRALAPLQPSAHASCADVPQAAPQIPAEGITPTLREDFSLSIGEFTRFTNLWYRHPAIKALMSGAADQLLNYTVIVASHPQHGFSRLRDTLDFVGHLARRTGCAVRVVVFAAGDQPSPELLTDPGATSAVVVACCAGELRETILSAGSDGLVQLLVSGDQICPVLAEVVASSGLRDFDLVLTDMYFQESEQTVHLVLLPGIDPIHSINADYFLSRAILRAGLAVQLLTEHDRFDPYELIASALCRCAARDAEARAHHVAFPMLRIAETRSMIERRRLAMLARSSPLRLPSAIQRPAGGVSVVICTKNNGFLLEQLVESLGRTCTLADIVVVGNRTTNPHAIAVHARLAAAGRIKLLQYDEPFNFSAQSNLGAAAASGDVLLFLNDDVVPVNPDWLPELIAPLADPAIGVVGPLLLYPDQSIQHAGMFLGYNRLAGHVLRGARLPGGDCGFMASAPRQVMAVTGAALAMRRADFETLGGFDRDLFALHIQDVDLCLRAHFSGLAVMYNPRAVLLHMESVSVKPTLSDPWIARRRALEQGAFLRRWGEVVDCDPFLNPGISPVAENMRVLLQPGDERD